MKRQLTITIPEPCHEKWDDMTPVEQGRFCGACQKKVVDFSGMTDKQILEVWKQNRYAMPCGRYLPSQLNRPMAAPPATGFMAQLLKRAAALLLLIETPAAIHAQQKPEKHVVTVPQEKEMKWGDGMSDVTGQLLALVTNKPITGQQLYIADIGATVITDSSGRFSFRIGDSVTKVKIAIGAKGAAEQEVNIETSADGQRSVVMKPAMTGAITLPYDPLGQEIYVQGAAPWWPDRDIVTNVTGTWYVVTDTIYTIKKSIRLPFGMKPKTGKSVMARLSNYWSGNKQQ